MMDSVESPESMRYRWSSLLLATLGGAALAADAWSGRSQNRKCSREASFITFNNDATDKVTIVSPGIGTDSRLVAEAFGRSALARESNLVVPYYQEVGYDYRALEDGLLGLMEDRDWRDPSFAGFSMGGALNAYIQRDYQKMELAERFGAIRADLKDSSPSGRETIAWRGWCMLLAADIFQYSSLFHAGKRGVMNHFEDWQASANTRACTIAQEGRYLNSVTMEDGELADTVGRSVFVYGDGDPYTRNQQAAEAWNRRYGGATEVVIDKDRPYGSHAEGWRRPDKIAELLRGDNQPVAA